MDKKAKIEEFAVKSLEGSVTKQPFQEPESNGEWRRLSEHKWEFRWNGVVISTIFHKAMGSFALWFKVPDMSKKVHMHAADSFVFKTFDEAVFAFPAMLEEKAKPWCESILEILQSTK